jgi:ArsR family transcriptional regulator
MLSDIPALLRLLGDATRLRLLRVLSREPLNVSELTAVLGVAQSGVSRHLGLLRDAGLVTEERSGPYTRYHLAAPKPDLRPVLRSARAESRAGAAYEGANGTDGKLWAWLTETFERATPATKADDARLAEVRRVRKESFADPGRHGDERRQLVPGRSWAAWARALGLLLPALDVADLGCGEGYLTLESARWARHVTAVDRSREVLARGKELAARRKLSNITWKRGDLEAVPLPDRSVDLALLSQALHHAAQPARALAEAHRILRPGGRVLVLDLRQHEEAWVRSKLGDKWLGFSDAALTALLRDAGFARVKLQVGASARSGDPFTVLVAAGTRPAARASERASRVSRASGVGIVGPRERARKGGAAGTKSPRPRAARA